MTNFISNYTNQLIKLLQNIDKKAIQQIKEQLDLSEINNSKVYIIGNGGSASTASHMVNDLSIGIKLQTKHNFNMESLSDNSSVCSAIANDIGYENVFYAQLLNKLQKDDLVIAISCSGNSLNILKAVEYSQQVGSTIISLTGFDGGKLKKLSNINFHVPTEKGEYGLVEDMHLILDHILYSYYKSLKENK